MFPWKKSKRAFNPGSLKLDMHNHLLPGVDDGVSDIDESIDLLKNMADAGFESVITTPHIFRELYPNTADGLKERWEDCLPEFEREIPGIRLGLAAEYHYDDHFEQLIRDGAELLCMNERSILIEFPILEEPPQWKKTFFDLETSGYRIVLAHVERYGYFDESDWEEFENRGLIMQANLLSLTGAYGPEIKKRTEQLLAGGFIDLWGTDLHSNEQWVLFEEFIVSKTIAKSLEQTEWLNQLWNRSLS